VLSEWPILFHLRKYCDGEKVQTDFDDLYVSGPPPEYKDLVLDGRLYACMYFRKGVTTDGVWIY
jgi:hypothetical protein